MSMFDLKYLKIWTVKIRNPRKANSGLSPILWQDLVELGGESLMN